MQTSLTVAVILATVSVGVFVINRLIGPHDDRVAAGQDERPGTAAAGARGEN